MTRVRVGAEVTEDDSDIRGLTLKLKCNLSWYMWLEVQGQPQENQISVHHLRHWDVNLSSDRERVALNCTAVVEFRFEVFLVIRHKKEQMMLLFGDTCLSGCSFPLQLTVSPLYMTEI